MTRGALLEIENLRLHIPGRGDLLHGISFALQKGEAVALVGESGSGKSLTTRAALGLFPASARVTGSVRVGGVDTVSASSAELREIRRKCASMVFQDPRSGINPLRTLGDFLTETLTRWGGLSRVAAAERAIRQLERVGLPRAESLLSQYPHQLSGGMLQRVMIASALLDSPELLLCDEPTTALDVTTQAGIVEILREQQQSRGMGMLFITHNLGLASSLCERVIVLRGGRIVEQGCTEEVFKNPREEYTRDLLAATPQIVLRDVAAGESQVEAAPVLSLAGVSKSYTLPDKRVVRAVQDVSFSLPAGASLGIVGESGSGKSTLARMIVGLELPSGGELRVDGVERGKKELTDKERREFARHTQIVFQDPYLSLDGRIKIVSAVADVLLLHGAESKAAAMAEAEELLKRVGIGSALFSALPAALSGGQRQRVALAKALAAKPALLLLDEATSALDVSVQAQVLDLIEEVREQFKLSIVFVSHDLAVVSRLCERLLVMRQGAVVESGFTSEVLAFPREDYTRELLASRPVPYWEK